MAVGGRTGVTAIVTGFLFLVALTVAPLGKWIPAFLTMIGIPLTYSTANGLAFGFTAYTLIRNSRGQFREVSWFVYLLTALFLLRFYYIGKDSNLRFPIDLIETPWYSSRNIVDY